ncbi:MAG TPA: hypothetical protein PKA82_04230 [Pyrinomonadaceae bacterium]|nr:hypothetical protein [Pyrinomonadaceae bacterium]
MTTFQSVSSHTENHSREAIAVVVFGLGIALPLMGLVLAILHSVIETDVAYGRLGTICLILTIPVIMIGSHLMDLFDRSK